MQQRELSSLNLVFRVLQGTRGRTGPPCPSRDKGPARRHLQMCAMAGTICGSHSLYKWIISGCKSARWSTVLVIIPPQMPKCALATSLLEKADVGRWGQWGQQVLRPSCNTNPWTKMWRFSFIYLARLRGPITKTMTSNNILEKNSFISLHGSRLITFHPAKWVYWQERQNLLGEGSSWPHHVTQNAGYACHAPSWGKHQVKKASKLRITWCKLLKTVM